MPRKKKLSPAEQAQREAEALNSPVRLDGQGEHPAIQQLMSPEFEKMSNLDASQIALMLQEIVRGQNSLLQQNSIQIAQIRERQDQIDRDIAERLESQQKFIEEVMTRAEDLKRTGLEQDRLIAQGAAIYQKAREEAIAKKHVQNIEKKKKLLAVPKVTVVSAGQLVSTMQNGQPTSLLLPEEVHIHNLKWVLPPGVAVDVPETVAGILAQRRQSQIETSKRQQLLSKNLEANKLAEEWNKIEGSKTEAMPQ
jgi:hypothetical protein